MAEEFDGETRWPSDVWPDCCDGEKMTPTAQQELLQHGEPCYIMEWTCMKCQNVRDVTEPSVWAAAYAMVVNPIVEKAVEIFLRRCKDTQ